MASQAERDTVRATSGGVAVVLALTRTLAVAGVAAGLVIGWVFPEVLPGWGRRLQLAGVMALTAGPFLALLRLGLGKGTREHGAVWYALGALLVVLVGAFVAR